MVQALYYDVVCNKVIIRACIVDSEMPYFLIWTHVNTYARTYGHARLLLKLAPNIPVKCLPLWGERERNGRHYTGQRTVQHSVEQPCRSLLLSRRTQTGRGWIGSAVIAISYIASLGRAGIGIRERWFGACVA